MSLADVYFRAGDTKNAILKFEQAQMLDPYLIKGEQSCPLGGAAVVIIIIIARRVPMGVSRWACPDGRVLCRSLQGWMSTAT